MSIKIYAKESHRFEPVGRCIYCGTTAGELTKEHIIPLGINGTLLLPEASCKSCALMTSKFEERVLRGFMKNGRMAMKLKTRHKNRARPATVPTTLIYGDGSTQHVDAPWPESMQVLHLPIFAKPGFLGGDTTAGGIVLRGMDTATFGRNVVEIAREHNVVGLRFTEVPALMSFVQLLAKIAHGYHIALHGYFPPEESPLLPIIHGAHALSSFSIGCSDEHPLLSFGSTALHLIDQNDLHGVDGSICSSVRLRLFSTTSGPTYVMAARLSRPKPSELP